MQQRVYKKGVLVSIKYLQFKQKTNNQQKTNNDCIDWYWVTTFYYADGSNSQTWQYLFTTCGECNVNRSSGSKNIFKRSCGGDGTGGGSVFESISEVNETENEYDETDLEENGEIFYGKAPLITYSHHATVARIQGEITSVIIDPTTVDPVWANYSDKYGRNTTRTLSPYDHLNLWWPLGFAAEIYWSCHVFGKWVYTDGSPIYSRPFFHEHTELR